MERMVTIVSSGHDWPNIQWVNEMNGKSHQAVSQLIEPGALSRWQLSLPPPRCSKSHDFGTVGMRRTSRHMHLTIFGSDLWYKKARKICLSTTRSPSGSLTTCVSSSHPSTSLVFTPPPLCHEDHRCSRHRLCQLHHGSPAQHSSQAADRRSHRGPGGGPQTPRQRSQASSSSGTGRNPGQGSYSSELASSLSPSKSLPAEAISQTCMPQIGGGSNLHTGQEAGRPRTSQGKRRRRQARTQTPS